MLEQIAYEVQRALESKIGEIISDGRS